jgi:predicted enzyme related to lactoylglutathione lyase
MEEKGSLSTCTRGAKVRAMGQPVVHFEIIGRDPSELRSYYGDLFGWTFRDNAPVAPEVSQTDSYSFIDRISTDDGTGIPGGIGGGSSFRSHALFYVGVPDVEAALQAAERLGGTRVLGPARNEAGGVVVGHFTDPAGNLVGVAGPA